VHPPPETNKARLVHLEVVFPVRYLGQAPENPIPLSQTASTRVRRAGHFNTSRHVGGSRFRVRRKCATAHIIPCLASVKKGESQKPCFGETGSTLGQGSNQLEQPRFDLQRARVHHSIHCVESNENVGILLPVARTAQCRKASNLSKRSLTLDVGLSSSWKPELKLAIPSCSWLIKPLLLPL
jgi:hypothetical protein